MSTITPQILLRAYAAGVFPMAESAQDNALYWVEPEERGVIPLDGLKISHSLRKAVRKKLFEVKVDHDFPAVIADCAARAPGRWLASVSITDSGVFSAWARLPTWVRWRSTVS